MEKLNFLIDFFNYRRTCPFCEAQLKLITRINGEALQKTDFMEDKIVLDRTLTTYSGSYKYTEKAYYAICLNSNELNIEFPIKNIVSTLDHHNFQDHYLRFTISCKSCNNNYYYRTSKIDIDNAVKDRIEKDNKTMLLLSYKPFSFTEECSKINNPYCTHFIFDPFEEKSILSWGKDNNLNNGYVQYNTDKEVHLDSNKYNFNDVNKILNKIEILSTLK